MYSRKLKDIHPGKLWLLESYHLYTDQENVSIQRLEW